MGYREEAWCELLSWERQERYLDLITKVLLRLSTDSLDMSSVTPKRERSRSLQIQYPIL